MTMDIGKSFTYMFEDPNWLRKLGIGTAVVLIGLVLMVAVIGLIPLIILLGYTLEATRNVLEGREYPLPEWDDWGKLLSRGIKLALVYIVWSLPFIVSIVPSSIGSALLNSNSGGANAVGGLLVACASCLALLWGLVLLLFTPAIYAQLARTDQIASGFDFVKLWAITRANLANVIIALLLTIVVGIIAAIVGMAGVIAIGIGLLVTIPFSIVWQSLVQAHLYAKAVSSSVSSI